MTANQVTEAWGTWVAEMGDWHVFGGITYDPKRRTTQPGSDVVRAHVRSWIGRDARKSGICVEAGVVALEYQRNGWPHCHPLLRVRGGARAGLYAELGQLWFKRHGYAKLERPKDTAAVSSYAAKYLAKDLDRGDVMFWPVKGPLTIAQLAL